MGFQIFAVASGKLRDVIVLLYPRVTSSPLFLDVSSGKLAFKTDCRCVSSRKALSLLNFFGLFPLGINSEIMNPEDFGEHFRRSYQGECYERGM
jgi:hypothetical protein